MASCTTVAIDDAAAPATALRCSSGVLCTRSHRADRAVLETKPENNPREREADLRAQRTHRDVAEAVDRHDEHGERPQLAQVDHAPRIDRLPAAAAR